MKQVIFACTHLFGRKHRIHRCYAAEIPVTTLLSINRTSKMHMNNLCHILLFNPFHINLANIAFSSYQHNVIILKIFQIIPIWNITDYNNDNLPANNHANQRRSCTRCIVTMNRHITVGSSLRTTGSHWPQATKKGLRTSVCKPFLFPCKAKRPQSPELSPFM